LATGNNPGGAPLQPAYILHRRNYGNSSLLLECFTPAGGRFPAIARGASARFSKGASMPQPFQPFWLKLAGRGEVRTLAACEAAAGPAPLQGERLYCAFYLNELLLRLLPRDDPHALLFDRYAQTLTELSDGVAADLLRRFEVALLQALGYGAPLHLEASGGRPVMAEARYHYHLEEGPIRNEPPAGAEVSGATLLALAGERPFDDLCRREARALMRRLIDHYLGGRPLKSRELFRQPGRG